MNEINEKINFIGTARTNLKSHLKAPLGSFIRNKKLYNLSLEVESIPKTEVAV
jgi:hypothetical protein